MIAQLFVKPIEISFQSAMWYIIPLCAAVAIVYKTIRTDDIRKVPRAAAVLLFVFILPGLALMAAALWAIHAWWP